MSSCCDQSDPIISKSSAALTIALAGNPNSGKTTIFNALTGLRQKVGNYPGVTIEKKVGRCKLPDGRWSQIIDLPGTYSLISRSPDERVAMQVLRGLRADTPAPDVVIVVVDASNLQRNLYLVSQLIELGRPLVVALNMMDVARRRGISLSVDALKKELGVPVIPIVGHRRRGILELKKAILEARVAPMPDWILPDAMKDELMVVGGGLAIIDSRESGVVSRGSEVGTNTTHEPRAWICRGNDSDRKLDRYQAIAERLLIGDRADDLGIIAAQEPVASLLSAAMTRMSRLGIDPMHADVEAHYRWIEGVSRAATATGNTQSLPVLEYEPRNQNLSDKVDQIFMHKVWGFVIFGIIMAALFVSIFWVAQPMMDGISSGIDWLGGKVSASISAGPIHDLVKDGIFAGVGTVVVFVPQIAILFLFLAILEDSGYLARAAFLMDRALSKVGLHGKSFIPLLSSFACAIPGIMAARTIENRKDRLATIFVAPFMSCSARLPVYALLIGSFFATYSAMVRGGIMLSCYVLGILAAAGTAWFFKRSFLRGPAPAFILEMPSYKFPQVSQVLRAMYMNTGEFIKKAGTTIFCLSVILWAMAYYPRLPVADAHAVEGRVEKNWPGLASSAKYLEQAKQTAVAAEQLRYSVAGRFGKFVEPAIRPLGFDWKMGVGLVGAFAAREVFVSTMGIVYSVGKVEDDTADLSTVMRNDRYQNGKPVWTPLVAISLLVWFVLAMQCMSTIAIVRRETGGWKWPIAMLVYMNVLAYVVSLAVFQIGRIWFA
jgi:ferrous iron transport protein B